MALKRYTQLAGWLSAAALCLVGAQAQAEALLERAVTRGSLNVCTGDEYPPFKFIDAQGHNNGLIFDLIVDLQQRLSQLTGKALTLNIVQVTPVNRTLFLNQGRCEFLVTSLLDTPARHREVDFVSPGYYSSAATVFAAKSTPLATWDDLRGKTLCAPPTSVWVRPYEARYGVSFASFNGLAEIRKALIDGRCIGALGDDVLYRGLAQEPDWQDFEVKLPSQDAAPWGIALRKGQEPLLQALSGIVRDWHASGLIIDLEKKYRIQPNPWVAREHVRLAAQASTQGPDAHD